MKKTLVVILTTLLFLLTGCVNPLKTLHDADYNITQTQQQLESKQHRSTKPAPVVVTYSGYYVNPKPMSLDQAPDWAKQNITVSAQNAPFNFVVSRILRDTNSAVSYQAGINQNQSVTINYHGTIAGALDELAADTNYAYQIEGNIVSWQALLSKTFDVSFMPGTSSYQVGQNEGMGAGEAAAASSGGGGSNGQTITSIQGDLGAQQYSNLKGNLSVWDDLSSALNALKSKEGRVVVSQSTTTVTVTDHPANVQAIDDYIKQLNRAMSREVAIQVEVLEIELNKEFNYGVNWFLIQNWLGTQFGLTGTLGDAANIAGAGTQGAGTQNSLAVFQIGKLDGSHALINALSQQGRLRVVTQPRLVTMNNQIAEVRITRDVSYLQSVSNTTTANAGNASNTQTLTPGIVTDGFALYLLPKIQSDKIYLQISSSLSTLTAIDTVSNNGTKNQPVTTSDDTAQPYQAIQVPTLANKTFNQRTVISSGATLVIAGFQQLRDETNRDQLAGIQPLGGVGAERRNVQTIVLITPTILGKM